MGSTPGCWLNGTLNSHLEEVDRQAQKMLDDLTRADEGAERSDGAAEGGGSDAMGAMMNSIRHSAEEVILNDLIYA